MISPSQILHWSGGNCIKLFGTAARRTAPIARRGEDIIETFTGHAPQSRYTTALGELLRAETDALRVEMLDLDVAGTFDVPALRLEDAHENLILHANDQSNAAWTKVRSSITVNAETAPNGNTHADRLVEDSTASNSHYTQQDITITANVNVAFSVYAKEGTRSFIALQIIDTAEADNVVTWFNLNTGALGTTGTVGGTGVHARSIIERLGDGWYRCTVVGSIGGGVTTARLRIFISNADGIQSYNGDGSSYVPLWGAQGENNVATPSSFVDTVASTVTQAKDVMTFPWVASPQTTIGYARFVERGAVFGANGTRIFQIGNATSGGDPRLLVSADGSNHYRARLDDGTTQADSDHTTTLSYGDLVELRFIFDKAAGTIQLGQSINGAAEVVATAGTGLDEALLSAWAGTILTLNADGGGGLNGFVDLLDLMFVQGAGHTVADFRLATQQ